MKAKEGASDVFCLLAKGVGVILLGGIEYLAMWNLHLLFFHVQKSSYAGADTYSLLNSIKRLPVRVMDVFQWFGLYFKGIICKTVCFGGTTLYVVFFILAMVILAVDIFGVFKLKKRNGIVYLLLVLVLPLAVGAVLLVATEIYLSVQMTGAYALVIPLLLLLLPADGKRGITLKALNAAALIAAVMRYCFIGIPAGNPMYYRSETFWVANGYTYIGGGWPDSGSITKSWKGLIRDICQINMNICSANEYDMLSQDERVANMPVFPAKGSIIRIDDIVIIKVS